MKRTYYDYLYGVFFKANSEDIERAENVGAALAIAKKEPEQVLKGIYGELGIEPPKDPRYYENFKEGLPFTAYKIFEEFNEDELAE